MLRLQNGRFDDANRLFCSIKGSWDSVCKNAGIIGDQVVVLKLVGDLKELTPEFFSMQHKFLLNSDGLKLGRKQDKTWVGDVELPPWAKGNDKICDVLIGVHIVFQDSLHCRTRRLH